MPLDREEIGRILIVKLSSMGDVVHALPTLCVLRRSYPRARLAWLVEPASRDLLDGHPSLDEVVIFARDRGSMRRSAAAYLRTARELRRKRFDCVVDMQGIMKSALLARLSGAPVRVGFEKGSSRVETASTWLLNLTVSEGPGAHIVERYLELAGALGAPAGVSAGGVDAGARFDIPVSEESRRAVEGFLDESGISAASLVVFHPGTSWASKCWPADRYARLAEELGRKFPDMRVVVSSGPGEEPLAREIESMSEASVAVFAGRRLGEMAALLERSCVTVASDTGPLHLAAALGRPVVGLYGPTDPRRNGPYGPLALVVSAGVECEGCWSSICRRAPKCVEAPKRVDAHACMKRIEVSRVMEEVEKALFLLE